MAAAEELAAVVSGVKAVLFDIGGVLVVDGPDMRVVAAELFGAEQGDEVVEAVHRAVWGWRDDYDLDLPDADYWRGVAESAGAPEPSSDVIERLVRYDVDRWASVDPATASLARRLDEAGYLCGLLSNAPRALGESVARQPWAEPFRVRVFSYQIGVAKPAEASYAAAVAELGVEASEVLFLDDRQTNVDGARGAGLRSQLWTTASLAEQALAAHDVRL